MRCFKGRLPDEQIFINAGHPHDNKNAKLKTWCCTGASGWICTEFAQCTVFVGHYWVCCIMGRFV